MFRIYGLAALVLLAVSTSRGWSQCEPVPHAADDQARLNAFWAMRVRLCKLPAGAANAYADRVQRIVWADQDWLDRMAQQLGRDRYPRARVGSYAARRHRRHGG